MTGMSVQDDRSKVAKHILYVLLHQQGRHRSSLWHRHKTFFGEISLGNVFSIFGYVHRAGLSP